MNRNDMKRIVYFLVSLLGFTKLAAQDPADFVLPSIISDHAVMQRDAEVKLWGWCPSVWDLKIVCSWAPNDTVHVSSDKYKYWETYINTPKAEGPHAIRFYGWEGKLCAEVKDILMGETWLCSGQSNMEFMLKQASTARADIPRAVDQQLRLYDMKARWRTNAVEWEANVLDSLNHLQYYKDTEWKNCTPATASDFSAIAYYFGKMLRDSLNVPVGLICNAVGGSPTEAWVDRASLEYQFPAILKDWTKNDFIQEWVRGRAALNIKKSANSQQRHPYEPCYLYESGIRPLEQYPIRGVIWYQGESNAHNWEAHEKLFKLLVNSWRKNWNDACLPFYYVQLSSLNRPSWPWFRESQRRMLNEISHIGMAVSSDHGDSLDVHPTCKKPVGERLARWALNKTYQKNVIPSGPLFRGANVRGGKVFLSFDYGKGMRSSDGKPLQCFEVAEYDGIYYPATAEVVGDQVKVYSKEVPNPRYVRYGWQPFTRANLINREGLPASTFRAEFSMK